MVYNKYNLDLMEQYGSHFDIESLIIIMDGNVGISSDHEIVFLSKLSSRNRAFQGINKQSEKIRFINFIGHYIK